MDKGASEEKENASEEDKDHGDNNAEDANIKEKELTGEGEDYLAPAHQLDLLNLAGDPSKKPSEYHQALMKAFEKLFSDPLVYPRGKGNGAYLNTLLKQAKRKKHDHGWMCTPAGISHLFRWDPMKLELMNMKLGTGAWSNLMLAIILC